MSSDGGEVDRRPVQRARSAKGAVTAVVAVDWGGTWIRAAVVDRGQVCAGPVRFARPEGREAQLDLVNRLSDELAASGARPVAGLGVAIAGVVCDGGKIASAGNLGLSGFALRAELEARTGREVRVVNDTQAAALAESAVGTPGATLVLLTVGTGIGGAIVRGGRLEVGRGAAGDFGHTPLEVDGPRCTCGARGCFEQLASGRVLNDAAQRLADSGASPALAAIAAAASRPLHGGDLDAAARVGDEAALAVLTRSAVVLATGFRAIAAACDPDVIVLSGGTLVPGSCLWDLVESAWAERRSPWTLTELEASRLGEEAALYGAALLFPSAADGQW